MAALQRFALAWSAAILLSAAPAQANLFHLPPDPPENLQASYNAAMRVLRLSWQGPDTAESFNVYRDGVLVANVATPDFLDTVAGPALYAVTTVTSSGESAPTVGILLSPALLGRVATLMKGLSAVPVVDSNGATALVWCDSIIVIGPSPVFPFVGQIDEDCLPQPLGT